MREQDMQLLVSAIVDGLIQYRNGGEDSIAPPAPSLPDAFPPAAPSRNMSEAVEEPVCSNAGEALPDIGAPEHRKYFGITEPHKPEVLRELIKSTGSRMGTGKAGPRPPSAAYLRFLADHARSKGTVFKEVSAEWLEKNNLWSIRTLVEDKDTYLTRPDLGRLLAPETVLRLKERYPSPCQVQVVLSDGLSTDALLHNYEEILPPLLKGLKNAGLTAGEPFFLHYGRVKAEDIIGEALGCDVVLLLIGERPGLGQSESMSCYAVYRPTAETIESQRTVISNIHMGGIPPVEAAAVIVELAQNMLRHKASGLELGRKMGGQENV